MKNVKILGTGCPKCKHTQQLIESVAREKGLAIPSDLTIEKIEGIQEIIAFGVMSTPAVVIDGEVVHAGGIPARAQVETWLRPS